MGATPRCGRRYAGADVHPVGVRCWGQLVAGAAASILVQANVRGRDVGSFVAEARAAIAAQQRLRPVLMTGLVASIGFLPMALNTGTS